VKERSLVTAPRLKNATRVIIVLLFIQLVYGALMAGHKAAPAAPTWPDINGSFIPLYIFNRPEGWISIIENPVVIHFIHRMLAYLLILLILVWTIRAIKIRRSVLFSSTKLFPILFVLLQTTLGIFTVLTSIKIRAGKWNIFEWMAQLHQLVAIFLLLSLVFSLYLLRKKRLG
jgi:cytochrome c oxidase assembly protein subunit 15